MKIKVLLICVLLISLLIYAPATALGNETFSYFLLRPENFTLPEGESLWTIQTTGNNYQYALPPGNFLRDSAVDDPAIAHVYIENEGDYVIWGLVLDYDDASYGRRFAKIGFNGTYDENQFGSSIPGAFTWSRSKSVTHLTQGLHAVYLQTGFPSMCISAVFITDDLNLTLSTETEYESISMYEDKVKPSFSGEITAGYIDLSSYSLTFPVAADSNGIATYKYFIGDREIFAEEGIAYTAENLRPLHNYLVTATAYDKLGNHSNIYKNIETAEWKITGFTLKNENGEEFTNTNGLSTSTEMTLDVAMENLLSKISYSVLFVGIFSVDEDEVVASEFSNVIAFNKGAVNKRVSLTVPNEVKNAPENYVIKATLIDTTVNIMPHSEGIKIEYQEDFES